MRSIERFDVRPKFTGGSPAMVDQNTAMRVLGQELSAFRYTKEGIYGEDKAAEALRRGAGNIVIKWSEKGGKIFVQDLLTGETTARKTFPPKTGTSIFALSPEDVKRGMTVYLNDGGVANLIEMSRVDRPTIWLAKVQRLNESALENIDITQATMRPRGELSAGQPIRADLQGWDGSFGPDMPGGEDEFEFRRRV
jgi:hypothetical protein